MVSCSFFRDDQDELIPMPELKTVFKIKRNNNKKEMDNHILSDHHMLPEEKLYFD